MQLSGPLALALASFTAVLAVPAPVVVTGSTDVGLLQRSADKSIEARAGKLCDIKHGDNDCHGASGDSVNTHCACLYLIPGMFPHPGTWVFTCQPEGKRQC